MGTDADFAVLGMAVASEGVRLGRWGLVGDSFGLMTRVKDQFDPGRRLSPGRLLGGL